MSQKIGDQIPPETRKILALSRINGFGPISFRNLLEKYGSIASLESLNKDELSEIFNPQTTKQILSGQYLEDIDSYIDKLNTLGIEFVTQLDQSYPQILKEIYDPPIVLYYKGNFRSIRFQRMLSIVGTRDCTSYGRTVVLKLVPELVKAGFCIVSGLAFGIDKVVHEVTLKFGGQTVAVLPGGVQRATPATNHSTYQKIVKEGIVVSEDGLDIELHAGMFPSRNRIISGLSLGTVVVEAGRKSGALITAYQALEQGREVFAVPGGIMAEKSKGTNKIIKKGVAKLIQSVEDILLEFGIKNEKEEKKVYYSEEEQKIVDAIIAGKDRIDEMEIKTGIEVSRLLGLITKMEVDGKLAKNEKNRYFIIR